jgi:hypothetical protein
MSLLNTINDPGDLLKKLIREANSINFTNDMDELSDLIFNFSVTCHSLRDWCLKYQEKQSEKSQINRKWNEKRCLQVAKDIANSSKHFVITQYVPTLNSADKSTSRTIEFTEDQNIPEDLEAVKTDTKLRESLEKEVPSYQMEFVDGSVMSLYEYYSGAIRHWLSYFDLNSIPRDQKLSMSYVYTAKSHWEKMA